MIYTKTLRSILLGAIASPGESTISAHLMAPSFVTDHINDQTFADVIEHELSAAGYVPRIVTGVQIQTSGTTCLFTSDPIVFGDPVTVPPFRYLVIAYGAPASAPHKKQLLTAHDLAPGGGALESTNAALKISPPALGWFNISASQ